MLVDGFGADARGDTGKSPERREMTHYDYLTGVNQPGAVRAP